MKDVNANIKTTWIYFTPNEDIIMKNILINAKYPSGKYKIFFIHDTEAHHLKHYISGEHVKDAVLSFLNNKRRRILDKDDYEYTIFCNKDIIKSVGEFDLSTTGVTSMEYCHIEKVEHVINWVHGINWVHEKNKRRYQEGEIKWMKKQKNYLKSF